MWILSAYQGSLGKKSTQGTLLFSHRSKPLGNQDLGATTEIDHRPMVQESPSFPFLKLFTTCSQSTFEADCRRILGLDLDALDAAVQAEFDRLIARAGPVDRYRLEHLRLNGSESMLTS